MFLALKPGRLVEPRTGRAWGTPTVQHEVARRATWLLARGLGPGDRVFIHYGNDLEFFVDLLAVWCLGGCAIPIDARLTEFEVTTLARTAAPRFSLWRGGDSTLAAALSALGITLVDTAEAAGTVPAPLSGSLLALDQPALILFTSGTTGDPKGVVHTHRSLRARWAGLAQSLGLADFQRTLCLLPTHFGHGLICNSLFPWLAGQDLYILPPFKADLVVQLGKLIDEHGITFMSSVPAVWRLALKTAAPPRSGSLRRVFCGSAPLSAALWTDVQQWSGTPQVLNSYGITETGSWVAGTTVPGFTPEDGLIGEAWGATVRILESASTDGWPSGLAECKVGEAGFVWLNTPALMQGYFGRDDLTRQVVSQGWFMTGDIGYRDERGWLYLRGRVREEINKGGMKVYPGDVDAVADRHAKVTDVCTFAIEDDPLYGQNVGIALVVEDREPDTLRGLHAWLRQHLAAYQLPVRWYLVDAIPRTSRGKVNRAEIAKLCAGLAPLDLSKTLARA